MADIHDHTHAPRVDCEQALAEIYTYLDGELTDEKRTLIAGHLEACNPCIEVYDFEAELRVVISTRARNEAVPETLRLRIAEKLTLFIQGEFTDGDAGTDAGADPDADAGPSIGQPPASDA
jgi:anti-sigma factor (TIGR02949 family)